MSTQGEAPAGWRTLFSGTTRPIAIIIAVAVALHSANIYVASAVMPSVAADIGGLSLYAWATTVFVFAAVLGSSASATVLARYGTRDTYRVALGLVTLGTVVCAIAPVMPIVLAGRFVQGIGGGLLFALAYTLVHLVLPEHLWARAMGLVSAAWGIGTFAGPALGGSFAELEHWRLAYWIIVPVTVFFGVWGAAHLPRDAGRHEHPPQPPLRSVGMLGAGVLALSAASLSTAPAVNVIGLAAAFALLALWLRLERRGDRPRLLPTPTFTDGSPLRWLYLTMAVLMIAATPEVFIAYFGQQLQDLSPLAAGYLATALAAGWTTASLVLGGDERRRDAILRIAPLVSATGLLLLVAVGSVTESGVAVIAAIAAGFALLGWGIGMAWPHLITSVLTSVPEDEQGLAGASVTTVQLTAAAAGAAVGGAIVNLAGFADPGGVIGTQSAARWLYAAMLVAPIIALVTTRLALRRRSRVAVAPTPSKVPA